MNTFNEKTIKEAVDETSDPRGKHLLSSKKVMACLLKFLLPDFFKDLSVETIARDCFEGEKDDPFLHLLSEEKNSAGQNKYINDLVFIVKLPKPKIINGIKYDKFLVAFEVQKEKPSDYAIEVRALIYTAKNYLNENKYLDLKKAEEMYAKSIPILTIWVNINSSIKESRITYGSFKWNEFFSYRDQKSYKIDDEDSLMNIMIIDIGKDIDLNKLDEFTFLYNILKESDVDKIIKMFQKLDLFEKEEPEMIMAAVEQKFYDNGIKEGLEQGKVQGIEQGLAQGIEQGLTQGIEQSIKRLAKDISNNNPDLTEEEAFKKAKNILDPD